MYRSLVSGAVGRQEERSDFQTVDEYGDYIKANTVEGTRVECCEPGFGVGEQGRVTRNTGDYLEVSWDNGMDYDGMDFSEVLYGSSTDVNYWEVKLVASVGKMDLMAD